MKQKKIRLWTRFERWCKHHFLRHFERRWGRSTLAPEQFDKSSVNKILIIRQHDQIGDFILSTPALRAVRESFPEAFIALAVRPYFAPAAMHNKYVDQVIVTYERFGDLSLLRLRRFKKDIHQGFDLAVLLNTVSHSLTSDLVAHWSGARWVLGPDHLPFGGTTRNFFYNFLAPYPDVKCHQSLRNLEILSYLNISTDNPRVNMTLLPEETAWADEFLLQHGRDAKRPLITIQAGAAKAGNRWPMEHFAKAASQLADEFGAQFVLTWGPKEAAIGEELTRQIEPHVLFGGLLDLRKTAALFSRSDVVLCNDTGVMHLAAAVEAPLVAIFGPTDPAEWKPIGDEFIAVRAEDHQTASVTPEMVVVAARQIIIKRRGFERAA
jgi:heptosyltransferase II